MLEDVNMLHHDSPLALVGEGLLDLGLDLPGKPVFNCRLSQRDGKLVGKVSRKGFAAGLQNTAAGKRVFKQEYHSDWSSSRGPMRFDTMQVEMYFKVEKDFAYEEGEVVIWDRPLELLFGVRALPRIDRFTGSSECGRVKGLC